MTVEFFFVGTVAPLNFPVSFRGPSGNLPVGDSEIMEMPGEAGAKLGPVIDFQARGIYEVSQAR